MEAEEEWCWSCVGSWCLMLLRRLPSLMAMPDRVRVVGIRSQPQSWQEFKLRSNSTDLEKIHGQMREPH